jgi:hypothetical protein
MIFAQNTNVTPKLEVVGNLVKRLLYDDEARKQEGFTKMGTGRQMDFL